LKPRTVRTDEIASSAIVRDLAVKFAFSFQCRFMSGPNSGISAKIATKWAKEITEVFHAQQK
jgi:hypothetical protein